MIWLYFGSLQRHCCILSKAGFCTRIHVHTHLPTRIYTVHNVACDYKTMRMIPITTHKMSLIILSSHLLCVCMLPATDCSLKKPKNDLRSWPGHQKTVLWNEKKKHILWGPQFIYVPLAKWFNLLDSVLAHIKWRKFYINCETGARIKENNLQESACYVLSP